MKAFPKVIWITRDSDGGLLAWDSLQSADDGQVASYEILNEYEKRDVPEIRRKGTKGWFKP